MRDRPARDLRLRMHELVNLKLETADGRPLVHKFYRWDTDPVGLLVAFPGNHYGVDGPLLYYPCELLRGTGWDTLAVSYGFQSAMREPFEAGLENLLTECSTAIARAREGRQYPKIGLLGKSLGAAVVAQLCANEPDLADARPAYLTPALGTPFFDPTFIEATQPALLAVGTADRFYSAEAVENLVAQKQPKLILVDGADHSMNVAEDLKASIAAMEQVVQGVLSFMQGES